MFFMDYGGLGLFLDFVIVALVVAVMLSLADSGLRLMPDKRWRYDRPPAPEGKPQDTPFERAPPYSTIRGPY
jgi:hypothetical protein